MKHMVCLTRPTPKDTEGYQAFWPASLTCCNMVSQCVCHRTDPKDNEAYQEFCDKLDIEEEEEEEEQGNSDDEVQEQRGNTVAMNRFCPLSGKPVSNKVSELAMRSD